VKNGGVELIGLVQMENRGLKERLIRAIFGPPIVPFIHVGVMEFVAIGLKLVPLKACMEDIKNVVKDFVERQLRPGPFFRSFQMGVNVSVKVSARDFGWNPMVDERRGGGFGLGIHRQILPDEGGQFATQRLLYYSFILPYL
jgi:hypothetical protein